MYFFKIHKNKQIGKGILFKEGVVGDLRFKYKINEGKK